MTPPSPLLSLLPPPTEFDDAYMFLRYAQNLLAGHGLAWNPGGPAVNGATSLLHLAVVTALRAALPRAPDGRLLALASAVGAALAIAVLVAACARLAPLRGRGWIWAAALPPALLAHEAFRFHALTGMDTMLAIAANAALGWAALRLERLPTARAAALAGGLAYVATLARPDGALYAALVPALAIALLCPAPRGRLLLPALGALAPLLAVDLGLRRLLLGTALPLSFHAKRPGAYGDYAGDHAWNPWLFLAVFVGAAAPFLVALALTLGRATWRPAVALLAPIVPTFAALFGMNQVMGHLGRFFFPALPFVVLAAAVAIDRRLAGALAAGAAPPAPGPFAARVGAALLLALAARPALEAAGRRWQARGDQAQAAPAPAPAYERPEAAPLPELDSWQAAAQVAALARDAPPGAVFAMSEHGLVGARAPHVVVVDLLGLHDRAFARGFSTDALFARRPQVIWFPHPDHGQMLRDLLASPTLWRDYDVYPEAFAFGLAVRKHPPARAAAALAARWAAVYPGTRMEDHRGRPVRLPPASGTLGP